MKRYCHFILVLFITATARAQVNVDSLRRVINSKQPYQEKITASIKILENFETKNFDTTIIEGNKALALARKNTDSIAVLFSGEI